MVNTILNWESFEPKFGGWSRFIKPFFEQGGFDPIYQQLKKDSLDKHLITPESKNTFKFLEKVPPEKLNVLIIGMDSYPGRYKNGQLQATGVAFDCSNSPDGKIQPSLDAFYEGIAADLGIEEIKKPANLDYLCEQGIMLGNRALTCKLEKTGSHMGLWDPFWEFFLEEVLSMYYNGIPVILLGKDAQILRRHIFAIANPIFELNHPSFAARSGELWQTEKVFSSVNKLLKENNNTHLYWNYEDWELPF